jgi:ABC-type transporter Mla maintaining outer membrane lipid asymmetry permease subunit MlaE
MSASVPSKPYPRIRRIVRGWVDGLTRIGVQGQFYFQTLVSIREAFARYNVEMVRLIAEISLGTGALAIIGGSVVIVGFFTLSTGALVAVAGYTDSADARAALISITAEGRSVLAQVHAERDAAIDQHLARLDDADRQTLAEAVRIMRGLLDDAQRHR